MSDFWSFGSYTEFPKQVSLSFTLHITCGLPMTGRRLLFRMDRNNLDWSVHFNFPSYGRLSYGMVGWGVGMVFGVFWVSCFYWSGMVVSGFGMVIQFFHFVPCIVALVSESATALGHEIH